MGRGVLLPTGGKVWGGEIFGLFILKLRYMVHSEVFFTVYIPICACQFCDRKGDTLYGLMTKDISYNRPYASYM